MATASCKYRQVLGTANDTAYALPPKNRSPMGPMGDSFVVVSAPCCPRVGSTLASTCPVSCAGLECQVPCPLQARPLDLAAALVQAAPWLRHAQPRVLVLCLCVFLCAYVFLCVSLTLILFLKHLFLKVN